MENDYVRAVLSMFTDKIAESKRKIGDCINKDPSIAELQLFLREARNLRITMQQFLRKLKILSPIPFTQIKTLTKLLETNKKQTTFFYNRL